MRLTYVLALIVIPVLAACTASIDLEEPFLKIDISPKSVDWFQLALDSMVEVRSYLKVCIFRHGCIPTVSMY